MLEWNKDFQMFAVKLNLCISDNKPMLNSYLKIDSNREYFTNDANRRRCGTVGINLIYHVIGEVNQDNPEDIAFMGYTMDLQKLFSKLVSSKIKVIYYN